VAETCRRQHNNLDTRQLRFDVPYPLPNIRIYKGSYRRSEKINTSIITVRLCVLTIVCASMITIFWNPMTILNETVHERQATRSNVTFAHRMFSAVFRKCFL